MARSTDQPEKVKKTRWYQQIWQVYQVTRRVDPAVTWWLLAVFVGTMAVALAIGFIVNQVIYLLVVGFPFALLAAMLVLSRRAEAGMYRSIEGQPGAALAALRYIRKGWEFPEEPVAMDPRTQDMVFRGVGRAGVVLVGEGPPRVGRLLEGERKKVARVLPNVPIHVLQAGNAEGQVPLRKLPRTVQRLKATLTKAETAEVTKRLRALGGMRMPIPKGVDPTRARPDRKGLRGR
ncbi:DUF4191 domain-containing protein [Isoptericola sp. b441]|uniref:DUF4191 domain-containing protein n=1 Tax=Actinotalea lenta TaxID=3064654 RepID=A0ABT9DAQ9_9CELL|nr:MULTISPECIES: DUF4191 domain-containing protein [unclassified Isoptericola]MDO8107992.1 DUF4191 domain-containing protein [Isoptericola sp. b441]MDO8120341.1 DUF4191 domain-containing protein [Isoptericola sp. b490]